MPKCLNISDPKDPAVENDIEKIWWPWRNLRTA